MSTITQQPLLDERQAADFLNVRPQTLAVWRATKRYDLAWIKVGRAVRYSPEALAAFLESRTVNADSSD